jgi:hypothetical protein
LNASPIISAVQLQESFFLGNNLNTIGIDDNTAATLAAGNPVSCCSKIKNLITLAISTQLLVMDSPQ